MTDQTTEPLTQQQETVTKLKNHLRIEQGKRLVEYSHRNKEDLKRLTEQITKQDGMVEHKPRTDTNNYVYVGGLSLFALAIGRYLLYSKLKNETRLTSVGTSKTNTEPKTEIFLNCSKNFYPIIYHG